MTGIQLTDPALHAWFCGQGVADDLAWLARAASTLLGPLCQNDGAWVLHHARTSPDAAPPTVLEALYRVCPGNLAERIHEGLNLYWYVGARSLPPLLDLVGPMVQAELHLYTRLDPGGKPYRDHLVHMTRVASLAHLLLSRPKLLTLPAPLHWETIRKRWALTPEFHLLRRHAARRGLHLSDPAGEGRENPDPWAQMVPAAALLAGLLHDLGYLQKALGDVAERAVRAVPWMSFVPEVRLPFDPTLTPLHGLYEATFDATQHGQIYAPLPELLRRHYRDLHSLVGALWLANIASGDQRPQNARSVEHGDRSQAELTLQLAAMMAFAHDLALSGKTRQKHLGLRKGKTKEVKGKGKAKEVKGKPEEVDVLNLTDYPLCTLFALADVLQEFGRTVQVVDGEKVCQVAPMPGISFVDAESEGHGLPKCVEVRYLVGKPRRKKTDLLPRGTKRLVEGCVWSKEEVGKNVMEWLDAAELGGFVKIAEDRLGLYDPDRGSPDGLGRLLVS